LRNPQLEDEATIAYWTPAVTGAGGASGTERNAEGKKATGTLAAGRLALARAGPLGTPLDKGRISTSREALTVKSVRPTATSTWSSAPVSPFVNVCASWTLSETNATVLLRIPG
jgi:hypothetical protein